MSSKRKSTNQQEDESDALKKRPRASNRNKENFQSDNYPCTSKSVATRNDNQTESVASQNSESLIRSLSSQSQSSQSISRSIPNNQLGIYVNSQDPRIDDLIAKANESIFEKKVFTFGQVKREYCAIYNFFDCELIFNKKPEKSIQFKCIFCKKKIHCKIGEPSNLTKHLQSDAKLAETGSINHDKFNKEWYPLYLKSTDNTYDEDDISEDVIDLTKFFLSSNIATQALQNPYLQSTLERNAIYMPKEKTFVSSIIPKVVKRVKNKLEIFLQNALTITLIVDIWDSKQMVDFLGTCAAITFKDGTRKLLVIGLHKMFGDGHHNAENIAKTIEIAVNEYNFDKNKIKGVVCDEGSALLRLFKQILNLDS